ncbi:septum formation initiator family protein [Paenarthrobacter sp. NPDC089714]|uniref:FtsB family cell division protein n=1 Tax=Paenarthrobacter sp. NPDC089714 TaxID=3364377 RepID=UPI00382936F6
MATRRPKVPKADALGRPSGQATSGKGPGKTPAAPEPTRQGSAGQGPAGQGPAGQAGGDLIEAEFGATRASAAGGSNAKPAPRVEAHGKAAGPRRPGAPRTPVRPRVSTAGKPTSTGAAAAATKAPATGSGAKNKASQGTPASDPVPAKAFSGRVLALAVVMIAITIMLAPTVKIFLEKRSEISALEAEIASKEAEQADLNKQLSRWQDPNYVKQQARDRINMVMPGETGYWVFGGDEAAGTPGGRTGSGSSANPANLPWVDALWESIRRSATD